MCLPANFFPIKKVSPRERNNGKNAFRRMNFRLLWCASFDERKKYIYFYLINLNLLSYEKENL